eukprot:6472139-Amphidinium_carterae.2
MVAMVHSRNVRFKAPMSMCMTFMAYDLYFTALNPARMNSMKCRVNAHNLPPPAALGKLAQCVKHRPTRCP